MTGSKRETCLSNNRASLVRLGRLVALWRDEAGGREREGEA